MQLTETRRSILLILICMAIGVSMGVCTIVWLHTPPAKAKQLRPLMKEIADYKAKTGKYPTSCDQFASFAKLTNQFSIYSAYSEPEPEVSIFLAARVSAWDIEKHDFTILLMPDGYEIFFPIAGTERSHQEGIYMSMGFSAWCYNSKKVHWSKGRVEYTGYGGSNWKPSFLR